MRVGKSFFINVLPTLSFIVKVLPPPYTDVIRPDPALFSVRPEPVVYRCKKCRLVTALLKRKYYSEIYFLLFAYCIIYYNYYYAALVNAVEKPKSFSCTSRRILASGSNLLLHTEGKTPRWPEFLTEQDEATTSLCTQMHFIEPIVWMREAGHNLQGKLHCPNALCKSKLGSFSWVMG